MLRPEYLARAPDRIVALCQGLEEYIIKDIARRISTSEGQVVTQTALRQWEAAARAGMDMDAIDAKIAKLMKKTEAVCPISASVYLIRKSAVVHWNQA